jgi:glutamine synthetase
MRLADNVVLARATVAAVARKHDLKAIFLPKVYPMEAGNGLHIHMSFRDLSPQARLEDRYNAFRRTSVLGAMSHKGSSFLEGILDHLPALLSLTLPSSNSFRRVGLGCWTGHKVRWAVEDKESPLRVCMKAGSDEPSNVELKLSDSTANIYLELAGILSAGLDGIARKLQLRPKVGPTDVDSGVPLPDSLGKSLECLKKDDVLMNVMGKELSTGFIALKEAEIANDSEMSLEDEVAMALKKA